MGDQIKQFAAEEGWSDATLIAVLMGVLEEISDHIEPGLILALIKERAHG